MLRAGLPPRRPAPKPPSPWPVRLVLLAVLVGLGVAGFLWFRPRSPAPAAPVAETLPQRVEGAAAPPATSLSAAPVAVDPPPVPAAAAVAAPGDGIPVETLAQLRQEQPLQGWRLVRPRELPAVLVIEFPDLDAQGRTLNRIAALLEKAHGRRDRVLDDTELARLVRASGDSTASFYLGHDYRGVDLARFYAMAAQQKIVLNEDERRLRAVLLQAGVLAEDAGGALRGVEERALVSFSAVQATQPGKGRAPSPSGPAIDRTRRLSILSHELSHGRYYSDPAYRQHCAFFWRQLLGEAERDVWRRYLASQGYDRGNEDLMINETQALLMHTPDTRDFSAATLRWKQADLEALRQRFGIGWPG